MRLRGIETLLLAGLAAAMLTAALLSIDRVRADFYTADNDDLMRLQVVRDWLAGQGWFDHQQYRLLGPEGISMHWSRYLDAGLAALMAGAGLFVDAQMAQWVAVALWPVLLGLLMVVLLYTSGKAIFGFWAGVGAVCAFLTWAKTVSEFSPGRIDHHNLQMLAASATFLFALRPARSGLYGALAGACAALSLAVGLEMLPVLLMVWGLAALAYGLGLPAAGPRLAGFSLSIALVAPLAMAGQTAPAQWAVRACDVLGLPILALVWIGAAASLLPLAMGARLARGWPRLGVMVLVAGGGLFAARDLFLPCLIGPYAVTGLEVAQIIDRLILEARSPLILIWSEPALVISHLLPVILLTPFAFVAFWLCRPRLQDAQIQALWACFILVGTGLVFSFDQIRAINMTVPAVPLLAGFLLQAFVWIPRRHPLRLPALLALIASSPISATYGVILGRSWGASAQAQSREAAPPDPCRTPEAMQALAALPQGVVFSSLNQGAAILLYTPHGATAAPYHRSLDAFANGVSAYDDPARLRDGLLRSRADYLMVCDKDLMGAQRAPMRALLAQPLPQWLQLRENDHGLFQIYAIDHAALRAEQAP